MLGTHLPRPPTLTTTQRIPLRRRLRPAAHGWFPRREGAGHPGARHGASPAPGHGSVPHRYNAAIGTSTWQGTGWVFPGRTKSNREGGEGGGEAEGRETKQLHGCRMSRTALHGRCGGLLAAFIGRTRREKSPPQPRAGTSGRGDIGACAPGGVSRGGLAYRHLRRKELHEVPRGQSQSFPIRAPFLTAHCSPASHCGQRQAVRGTPAAAAPSRPVASRPAEALTMGTCPNFFS